MGRQGLTPTEAGRSSNQGPLGNTGTPRSGAIVLVTVNRGHSPPDLVRRQLGIEFGHNFPLSPDGRASQIATQGGGSSEMWRRFAVGLLHRYVAPERRASSQEQVKPPRPSGSVRNHVSRNNVTRKHAGYSGRPLSSTGRRRRARTLTSLACIGDRNLRSIESPQSTRHHGLTSEHERGNRGTDGMRFGACDPDRPWLGVAHEDVPLGHSPDQSLNGRVNAVGKPPPSC